MNMASCSRTACTTCRSLVLRSASPLTRRSLTSLATTQQGGLAQWNNVRSTFKRPTRSVRFQPFALDQSFHTSAAASVEQNATSSGVNVLGKTYEADDYTNITQSISSRLTETPQLIKTESHPLQLLCSQIHQSMPSFDVVEAPSPVVSVDENFGSLGFPEDHPGRSPTDTYYLNRQTCLRTHTSTHEVDVFAKGHTKWLLTADVFRRDEIDASHYPIFHQMEGACVYDLNEYEEGGRVIAECQQMEQRLKAAKIKIVDDVDLDEAGGYQASHINDPRKLKAAQLATRHLKATLNNLVFDLFSERHAADEKSTGKEERGADATTASAIEPLTVRWIPASFPFTSPSFEIEVMFRGKWLEILGCGVVMERTLENARVDNKLGWAFGLGLERIAMILFQIPDIRLFWSKDARFISQFALSSTVQNAQSKSRRLDDKEGQHAGVSAAGGAGGSSSESSTVGTPKLPLITFKPYSRYPPCYKDASFWLPVRSKDVEGATTTTTMETSTIHENDVFEVIRDVAGDLTEDVTLIDDFVHPKTGRQSKCFRINYRSMDRNLDNEEVNELHAKVTERLVRELGIEMR